MSNKHSWTTHNEISFLNQMGPLRETAIANTPRRILLLAYRDSMCRRDDWGNIDPEKIRAHVDNCIHWATSTRGLA